MEPWSYGTMELWNHRRCSPRTMARTGILEPTISPSSIRYLSVISPSSIRYLSVIYPLSLHHPPVGTHHHHVPPHPLPPHTNAVRPRASSSRLQPHENTAEDRRGNPPAASSRRLPLVAWSTPRETEGTHVKFTHTKRHQTVFHTQTRNRHQLNRTDRSSHRPLEKPARPTRTRPIENSRPCGPRPSPSCDASMLCPSCSRIYRVYTRRYRASAAGVARCFAGRPTGYVVCGIQRGGVELRGGSPLTRGRVSSSRFWRRVAPRRVPWCIVVYRGV